MQKNKRLSPDVRKEQILQVAIRIAAEYGLYRLNQRRVARLAGVSSSLVPYYFRSIKRLRCAVINRARKCKDERILRQVVRKK